MDAFEVTELPAARRAVFVTSTMGQGDPPSNARSFWKFLLRRSLPADSLRSLAFACFGLGDSHYAKYNVAAKKLHRRLETLGATSLVAVGLGDDQHPAGYDHALDPWLERLWNALALDDANAARERNPDPKGRFSFAANDDDEAQARFDVFRETAASRADDAVDAPPCVETLRAVAAAFDALAEAAAPVNPRWRRRHGDDTANVASAAASANAPPNLPSASFGVAASLRALTADSAVAHSAHLEIRLETAGAPLSYDVGDCLEVLQFALYDPNANATGYGKCAFPENTETLPETRVWSVGADAVLRRAGVDPRAFVRVSARRASRLVGGEPSVPESFAVPARHLVLACLDIASASPRRYFYETAARFAASADEKERLEYFASPEGRDDARRYGAGERRTLLEFLDDFPSVAVPLGWLLQTAPRLRPRLFSIASARAADGPETVHLTVTRAAWTTPYGRARKGLCSTALTSASPIVGARLAARVVKGAAAFPDDSQPVVAVCTGSGVAPVRAMVRQRDARFMSEAEAANQTNVHGSVAPTLVFFGCRHRSRDFLYADEWADLVRRGTLLGNDGAPACGEDSMANDVGDTSDSMFTPVFSRDGERKRYVSHALRDDSRRVWDVLRRERAAVVVCGSTGAMPEDVHEALVDVCVREGGMDDAQARAFLRRMDARGDYVVEAW
jgi:sulfite reductase alpha subunit-like flavoprotein